MGEIIKLPGLIDLHVHLREHSTAKSETIENGSFSASRGGYSLICDMPNDQGNPTWTIKNIESKIVTSKREARITTLFYAGSQPESNNIDQLEGMSNAGAVGLKLYTAPTTGNENDYAAEEFEEIVKEWHRVAPEKPIMLHSGKNNLKDFIELVCDKNSHHLHVCHVHNPEDVKMINSYKKNGLKITCGVCPHHFLKTSHDRFGQGWFARMQPPLQDQVIVKELVSMLASGEIDVIESDYAPHTPNLKLKAEVENPNDDEGLNQCYGMSGIEHVVPIMLNLVRRELFTMDRLIDALHTKPLEILNLEKSIFDPEKNYSEWDISDSSIRRISEREVLSGSGWSPYVGYISGGKLLKVVSDGQIVHGA